MADLVFVAPLKEGMADRVRELLAQGPPFDLEATMFDRHTVHVTDREVVFVFESKGPSPRSSSQPSIRTSGGPPRLGKNASRNVRGSPEARFPGSAWTRPRACRSSQRREPGTAMAATCTHRS